MAKKVGIQRAKAAAVRAGHVDFWASVVHGLGGDSALAGRDAKHIRAPFVCLAPSTLALIRLLKALKGLVRRFKGLIRYLKALKGP